MVKAEELIRLFRYALDNNWGYIWGRSGQVWTAANQRAATRPQTVAYGKQWIGHHVADCSGIGFWAFQQLGGYIYHGSNTIWNQYVTHRSALKDGKRIDGREMFPGDPVFLVRTESGEKKRHHIGYYVGNDIVIEAKGTKWGVVTSKLSNWDETAHWVNVCYENGVIYMAYPILRKGASGEYVTLLQNMLNANGYDLTVDGKFGAKTQNAVKDYQLTHGLVADGIVGDATWSSLIPEPGPEPGENVTVSRNDLAAQKRKLLEVVGWIDKVMEG